MALGILIGGFVMPREVRMILDELGSKSLTRLCRTRDLQTSGTLDDKRKRLSYSYRGDVAELVPSLRRTEMIAALECLQFALNGALGEFVGLRNASKGQLAKAIRRIYVDAWEPSESEEQPFGSSFVIRLSWDASEEDEDSEVEDGEDDLDEDDDGEDADDEDTEGDPVHDFTEWLHDHLGNRQSSSFLIKTLVNRLANYHADRRLSTPAVKDLASVLANAGITSEPDLSAMEASPGIDARVRISVAQSAKSRPSREKTDWLPVPGPPGPNLRSSSSAGIAPATIMSDFERSAAKLKFLITVAASVSRLADAERLAAVECCAVGSSLSRADQIRLKALAHQYSTGHEDLLATVKQLRVTLTAAERMHLLRDLRRLTPSTPELEDLVTAYSADLGVEELAEQTPPSLPRAEQSEHRAKPKTETAPSLRPPVPSAGGVRDNAALDDIFGTEGGKS